MVLSETATHSGNRNRNRKVEGAGGAKFNTAGALGGEK